MSDIDRTKDTQADDADGKSRVRQAKAAIGQAGQALKDEAQTFAGAAQARARDEARKGKDAATKTLGDFANAIRRAGDELGETDQSPAARLVRQAADGLERISRDLAGKQPEQLLDDVRDFGRRNPIAFIGGAVLVGVALGRFLRATDSHAEPEFDARPAEFQPPMDLGGDLNAATSAGDIPTAQGDEALDPSLGRRP